MTRLLLGVALGVLLFRTLGPASVIVLSGATLVYIWLDSTVEVLQYRHDVGVARDRWAGWTR